MKDFEDDYRELMRAMTQRSEYQIAEGRTLVNVHNPMLCEGRGCSVHHPSDHRMKMWPKDFVFPEDNPSKWGYFMRYCQHRQAHPDPDDVAYYRNYRDWDITMHSCDGCCQPKRDTV